MSTTTTRTSRSSSEFALAGTVLEQFGKTVQRLWCWREFSLPAITVVVTYEAGDPDVALSIGLVLAIALVLLLLRRPGIVAGAFGRCRARSRDLSRQLAWPGVCESLGWTRRLPSGGQLVPALLAWAEDAGCVRISLRPLPEQTPRYWDQMADALRRLVYGESVQWRESRGTLTVLVSRHRLPSKLTWAPGLADAGRIVLGQRHGGELLALDVLSSPHVLLAGATGSGKGGAIRTALAGALEAGWQAVVLDPKESGEYRWVEHLGVPVLSSVGEQRGLLEVIEGVRHRRQAIVKRCGVDTWRELPAAAREGWRPILVVVDEAADLLVTVKGRSQPQREYAALQQKTAMLIFQLVRKGRSAGIHLIVAVQRPDTAQLGDQGGALRNNLTARLALGTLDAEGVRMLGIPTTDPVATTLDGTPGRGICVGFGDHARPGACQVAWLDQQDARTVVDPAAPQGLVAIQPFGRSDHDNKLDQAEDTP